MIFSLAVSSYVETRGSFLRLHVAPRRSQRRQRMTRRIRDSAVDELCVCLLVLIYSDPVTFVGCQCMLLALRSVQFTLEAPYQEDQDQGSDGNHLHLLWSLAVRFGFLPYRKHERTTASSARNSLVMQLILNCAFSNGFCGSMPVLFVS